MTGQKAGTKARARRPLSGPRPLAQESAGSAAAMSIGTAIMMTKGFAEEWLAWRDQQDATASAAVIGWIITIWRK